LRAKHKLFGNIDFVGELYKEAIISDTILCSIFENLLGFDVTSTTGVTDITIDAALKLISKLGKRMEEQAKKKKESFEMNVKIFDAFTDLQKEDNPKASLRVKLLIKNMFENKASGWNKSKEDNKEIKKKAEIE
jgi:hypothetical protein